MKLRHCVSGSQRLEWSYFLTVVNRLYTDAASYPRKNDSSPKRASARKRWNYDPSKCLTLSIHWQHQHPKNRIIEYTAVKISNLQLSFPLQIWREIFKAVFLYIFVTYMLHGSIKYSIFMSNKNTIHHCVYFFLHNYCTMKQVEDVRLLKGTHSCRF